MTNSEAPPSKGLVAGKYELVRLIGRGGMGSVWEARHASLGTRSAIKFIESEYADSHEARSRFDREAKAAATIQSKHAIQIFDHGVTDDGKPYIVMEFLDGEPLDKRIDRGPISLHDTARILQQVCRGLSRAHERGIIHRDLKPENIFLVKTPEDDEAIAKVLDFGIAKMQGVNAPGLTSSTKTGAVLGTPFYMSPEQARGLRNVDHRADVWSLGVIAFKCVTGKLPFDGESVGDLLVKICTAPVPVPSQVAASLGIGGIPPSFDAWFMRALEREPERRYPSVAQLAEDLMAAAGLSRGAGAPPSTYGTPPAPHAVLGDAQATSRLTPYNPNNYGVTPYQHTPPVSHQAPNPIHPSPAAMTNAPFTREEIAGVPSGKGKLVVGGIVAGIVAVAAVIAVVVMLRPQSSVRSDPTNGVGIVAPSSVVVESPKPPEAPQPASPPAAKNTEPQPSASVASSTTPTTPTTPPSPPPTPGTRVSTKVSPSKPVAPPPTTVKTSATPPLPPPNPTPTPAVTPAKKPNRNDPGY